MSKETKIFTVDFDNTCALEDFPGVGPDVPYAAETLKKLQEQGHKIILWTCRTNNQLKLAEKWFEDHGIRLDAINDFVYNERNLELIRDFGCPRKVIGDFNIDDKNLGSPLMKITNPENGKEYVVVDWQKIQKEIEKILGQTLTDSQRLTKNLKKFPNF